MRLRVLLAGGVLLASAVMSGCDSPSAPESRFVALSVAYIFVPPTGPYDPTDAGFCAHHAAPANLRISTSWDDSARLEEAPAGVMRADLSARRGGDYWISFVDIRYCGYDQGLVPPGGVSINGVLLTRSEVEGLPVFQFRVDVDGTVRPK